MQGIPKTDSEAERDRLRALRRFAIMDTPPEADFDRVAELAAHLFDVPVALVSFIDGARQWIKARVGTYRTEIPKEHSICAATIQRDDPTVVEDLAEVEGFAENPFVAEPPHARFYAGVPIETPDGYRIGTVSVLGPKPRSPDSEALQQLQHLADIAAKALVERQYALGERDELNQTVLDHLPGIFYVLGPEGRLKRWNARFEEISGYGPNELSGRKAFRLFEGADRVRIAEAIKQVFDEGNATVQADLVPNDGDPIPTLFSGVRTYLNGAPHLAGLGIDISERQRQAEALKEAKRKAEEASRVKSAMIKNLSHEIRTPLTSIIGFARVLEEDLSGEEGRIAGLIHEGGRRLKGTVDSVLQLSKLEAGTQELNREKLDLRGIVQQVLGLLQPQAENEGVEVDAHLPDSSVIGLWNEGALHRIAENLLENAIKFTPEGGTVDVRVSAADDEARLEVEDTGIGISEEALPDIFDPFKQESEGLTREFEGSGLGLSNVKELTELLGGSIDVETEKDVGTRFVVHLPVNEPDG